MNDTPKNLKHRMSWSVISNSFTCKAYVDHGQDGSPWLIESINRHCRHVPERTGVSQSVDIFNNCITQRWSPKRIVIIGWSDIKCIYSRNHRECHEGPKEIMFFSKATSIEKIGFLCNFCTVRAGSAGASLVGTFMSATVSAPVLLPMVTYLLN
nr:hypothetical protein [Tanacetum cinerariifolium]